MLFDNLIVKNLEVLTNLVVSYVLILMQVQNYLLAST